MASSLAVIPLRMGWFMLVSNPTTAILRGRPFRKQILSSRPFKASEVCMVTYGYGSSLESVFEIHEWLFVGAKMITDLLARWL